MQSFLHQCAEMSYFYHTQLWTFAKEEPPEILHVFRDPVREQAHNEGSAMSAYLVLLQSQLCVICYIHSINTISIHVPHIHLDRDRQTDCGYLKCLQLVLDLLVTIKRRKKYSGTVPPYIHVHVMS